MNKTLSIIRIAALVILSSAAVILLCFRGHQETSFAASLAVKAAGFAAGYAAYRLYAKWRKTDALIAKYDKWCEEGPDAPNPMRLD